MPDFAQQLCKITYSLYKKQVWTKRLISGFFLIFDKDMTNYLSKNQMI